MPNEPPNPGGSAHFQTDADPPAPPHSQSSAFEFFGAESAGYYAIKLTWRLNVAVRFDFKIERSTNGGTWEELVTLPNEDYDGTHDDDDVKSGIIYSYRMTAMQSGAELFHSAVVSCDVPLPLTAKLPANAGSTGLNKLKYKIQTDNPPSAPLTVSWREFYGYACPQENIQPIYLVSPGKEESWSVNEGESEEYTAEMRCITGGYTIAPAPKITLRLDAGRANLKYIACPENPTTVPCQFEVNDCGLPNAKYTLTVSGSDKLRVRGGGRSITGSVTFTRTELVDRYAFFEVVALPGAHKGDSITVNLQTVGPDEAETELGTDSHTFVCDDDESIPPATTLRVPIDEASGAKYRKIALNGRPLADEKPQTAPEDDQQREETFIDALTLGLRHGASDAYVPVAGSELALTVRRDTASTIWSRRYGLRPHERPDLPFGAGWSSNLTAHVRVVVQVGPNVSDANYAYVSDENGASYRFLICGENFFPFPTAKHEQNTYLTSLRRENGKLVFSRKFGSTLEYEDSGIQHTISKDRMQGSENYETTRYYRLTKITDRLGQVVEWLHESPTSGLVPKYIRAADRPDQTLYIRQNEHGLVTKIWDANWNLTEYFYDYDSSRETYLLAKTRAADGAETLYQYNTVSERDRTPLPSSAGSDPGNWYLHYDVAGITDPNGQHYAFTYMFGYDEQGHGKFDWFSETGYYASTGNPRMVSHVILPGGQGGASFENHSITKLIGGDEGEAELTADSIRKTRVRDAAGNWRSYQWDMPALYVINNVRLYYNSSSLTIPKII